MPGYLGPSLTEGFLRQYQVLPGRTHPMMNMSGSGGFILSVIKVYVRFGSNMTTFSPLDITAMMILQRHRCWRIG